MATGPVLDFIIVIFFIVSMIILIRTILKRMDKKNIKNGMFNCEKINIQFEDTYTQIESKYVSKVGLREFEVIYHKNVDATFCLRENGIIIENQAIGKNLITWEMIENVKQDNSNWKDPLLQINIAKPEKFREIFNYCDLYYSKSFKFRFISPYQGFSCDFNFLEHFMDEKIEEINGNPKYINKLSNDLNEFYNDNSDLDE
ncbi:MAG: hypothetical protein LBM96_02610 [Methanobrevibacter sp.]|jgi:hypothetical protein|nr:hypothetical protein [Candidatus Methanoflexus mossambicus]